MGIKAWWNDENGRAVDLIRMGVYFFLWSGLALLSLGTAGTFIYSAHFLIAALAGVFLIGIFLIGLSLQIRVLQDPPQYIVFKVGGKFVNKGGGPGYYILANFWPFFVDGVIFECRPFNKHLDVHNATVLLDRDEKTGTATAGGEVMLELTSTIEPDADSLDRAMEYAKIGPARREGSDITGNVFDILQDVLAETSRQMVANRTLDEALLAQAMISCMLIQAVTGATPARVPRLADGSPDPSAAYNEKGKSLFKTEPPLPGSMWLDVLDEIDYLNFLDHILVNGKSDVLGLGIRLRRLNVLRIVPQGRLAQDLADRNAEILERGRETMNTQTNVSLAMIYMQTARDAGQEITFADALQYVRLDKRVAREFIVRSQGGGDLNALAAALFGQGGKGESK